MTILQHRDVSQGTRATDLDDLFETSVLQLRDTVDKFMRHLIVNLTLNCRRKRRVLNSSRIAF